MRTRKNAWLLKLTIISLPASGLNEWIKWTIDFNVTDFYVNEENLSGKKKRFLNNLFYRLIRL